MWNCRADKWKQSVIVEDGSGQIWLLLWESQVGLVVFGKTYKLSKFEHESLVGSVLSPLHIKRVLSRLDLCQVLVQLFRVKSEKILLFLCAVR